MEQTKTERLWPITAIETPHAKEIDDATLGKNDVVETLASLPD